MNNWFKRNGTHLAIIGIFIAICFFYFTPAFQGKTLGQSDVIGAQSTQKEINDYRAKDTTILWTNQIFGGMPAYRAVKDDILRTEDGKLVARNLNGDQEVKEFLQLFVNDNPELLPARIVGGSGAGSGHKLGNQPSSTFDIDKIKPGMSAEDLDRARQEIARVAMQTLRGE